MKKNDIRILLEKLDSFNNIDENTETTDLYEEIFTEGILSDIWDKVKAMFGNDEAKGRQNVLSVAKLMRKRFKEYIGPRKNLIQTKNDLKTMLYSWLTNTLKYEPGPVEKAALINNFDFDIPKTKQHNNNNNTNSGDEEEDLFASVDFSFLDMINEDISLKNSDLDKFFVSLITVAEDDNKQSPYVAQRLEQNLHNITQKNTQNPYRPNTSGNNEYGDDVDDDYGSQTTKRDTANKNKIDNSVFYIDKTAFLQNYKKLGLGSNIEPVLRSIQSVSQFSRLENSDMVINNKPVIEQLAAIGFIVLRMLGDQSVK